MSDYASQPDPIAWQNEQIAAIWAAIRAMNGANGLESAVVSSGGLRVVGGGTLTVEDGAAIRSQRPGGETGLYFGQLVPEGIYEYGLMVLDQNEAPQFWTAQQDNGDYVTAIKGTDVFIEPDSLFMNGPEVTLSPDKLTIDSGEVPIYSLPTTSATANLHLGTVGGAWTLAYITSSRRYKTDIEDADIDPEAVLRWVPRTWRDKAEVEAIGDDATEHIGFIAEEIHDETPEFVVLDDTGRPDSLKYDRMVAGLHAVVKAQAEQIATLTARLDALEAP